MDFIDLIVTALTGENFLLLRNTGQSRLPGRHLSEPPGIERGAAKRMGCGVRRSEQRRMERPVHRELARDRQRRAVPQRAISGAEHCLSEPERSFCRNAGDRARRRRIVALPSRTWTTTDGSTR